MHEASSVAVPEPRLPAVFSPAVLSIIAMVSAVLLLGSPNFAMWAACFAVGPAAIALAGGRRAEPVVVWLLFMMWVAITTDVLYADISDELIAGGDSTNSRQAAILFSLAGMSAVALGTRSGATIVERLFSWKSTSGDSRETSTRWLSLNRLVISYFVAFVVAAGLNQVAFSVSGLTQFLLALGLVKFAVLFLIAMKIFQEKHGWHWLAVIMPFEIVSGMISYWSSYKEAIFILFLALLWSRQRLSARQLVVGLMAGILILWMSVVWSLIKQEYRAVVSTMSMSQKLEWMGGKYFTGDTDYKRGFRYLVKRVGYTTFFSKIVAKDRVHSLPKDYHFYNKAVVHVLTPRILFTNKATLNDSPITTSLLGVSIAQRTSVGVGYMAQAYVDYGFPGMLAPLWAIGVLIGASVRYFMSRPPPLAIVAAFATSAVFLTFRFEANIDKAFGGFITNVLVLALVLEFGYPLLDKWLRTDDPRQAAAGVSRLQRA